MHEKKFSSASSDVRCLSRIGKQKNAGFAVLRLPGPQKVVGRAQGQNVIANLTDGSVLDFAEANGTTKPSDSCRHTMTE